MFGYIAAVLFLIAAFISGNAINPGSAWLAPQTLIAAGLLCLALHVAGFAATLPVRRR